MIRNTICNSKALGHDVSSMTLFQSSVRRSHCRNRETQATVEQEFIRSTPLLRHWYGKLLPDITGNRQTVDRIAVLVTGAWWGKRCYSTDTTATATNTGSKNGACTFIEHLLDQVMSWVACRHHIMELVLASIFQSLFRPTRGPDVAIFKRFQTSWPYIDQSIYKTASDDV